MVSQLCIQQRLIYQPCFTISRPVVAQKSNGLLSILAGVPECWRGLWGTWRCFLFNSTMGGKEVQVHLWLMGWWSSDRFFGHHGVLLSCGLLGLYFADHRYACPRCSVHFHASSDVQALLALLVFAVGWGSGRDLFHLSFELVQVSLELRGFWIWSFRK